MKRAAITDVSSHVPARIVSNGEIEERVRFLAPGSLKRLFGIEERRFAADEQVSDLAVAAARPIVDRIGAKNIDYLIFAAASADLIEPATCNIVQYKLGLRC